LHCAKKSMPTNVAWLTSYSSSKGFPCIPQKQSFVVASFFAY
jgi:hypothetical protein